MNLNQLQAQAYFKHFNRIKNAMRKHPDLKFVVSENSFQVYTHLEQMPHGTVRLTIQVGLHRAFQCDVYRNGSEKVIIEFDLKAVVSRLKCLEV